MNDALNIQFGIPGEWSAFLVQYPKFIERFPNLQSLLGKTYLRQTKLPELTDRVIFVLGRLCAEDFMEILLLCGNGYGIAGLKILRSMFERLVTAWYLHLHPDETERFWEFHWVQEHKLANAMVANFGEGAVPQEQFDEIDENFERVRKEFVVTLCSECKNQGLAYRWSKLDFVSMAHAVGSFGKNIGVAYYLPMSQLHTTARSITSRLRENSDGDITFNEGPQRDMGKIALITTHNLLLSSIIQQKDHFGLSELEGPLQQCAEDFQYIWEGEKHVG